LHQVGVLASGFIGEALTREARSRQAFPIAPSGQKLAVSRLAIIDNGRGFAAMLWLVIREEVPAN
jgi:hypothetical protein